MGETQKEVVKANMIIEMVHRQENGDLKDSLEFGPANLRAKIYVNIAEPEDARKRFDEMKDFMVRAKLELEANGIDGGRKGKLPTEAVP
jgi:hypothetical protein